LAHGPGDRLKQDFRPMPQQDKPMTTQPGVGQDTSDHRSSPALAPPPMHPAWDRSDWLLVISLTTVAAMVILPNLGDRCLWQDEAESGLLARAILRTGLPVAWDGRLLTTAVYGAELTDSMLWKWHPWGSFYLAAAGIGLVGDTPFGARLPMALLGCLSVGLTYLVARRLVGDRWAACLASVLLLTSVQYLLMMRQCRYYSMLVVGTLAAVWAYAELPRRRGTAVLTAAMVWLFHSNYVTCACVAIGLGIHGVIWRRRGAIWIRLGGAAMVTAALTGPWFLAIGLHKSAGTLDAVGYHRDPPGKAFVKQLFVVNQFVCPWIVAGGLAVGAARQRLRVGGAYALVACLTIPILTVVPVVLWAGTRYLIHMMPLGAIVVAAAIREISLRNDVVGNIVAMAAGVTNLLPSVACGLFPTRVGGDLLDGDFATGPSAIRQAMLKSEWAGYVQELREPFVGPNEAVTRFLLRYSRPDDLVYTPFGVAPIMFATDRRCAGLLKPTARARPGWDRLPDYLFNRDAARWLIIRPAWQPLEGYPSLLNHWSERARRTGCQVILHPLRVADIGWGNRPEMRYHYFTSPGSRPSRDIAIVELRPEERTKVRSDVPPSSSPTSGRGHGS